jgi:hypothetical protein
MTAISVSTSILLANLLPSRITRREGRAKRLPDNSKKMLAAHTDDNMMDRWVHRGVSSDPPSSSGLDVSLITARSA